MEDTAYRAVAIVGMGAILPDAPNAAAFWNNIKSGRYSISEVGTDRWDSALYYDADHSAPDKTYSKIGGWVREAPWEPMKWRLPIPPKVADAMDGAQQWAIACTREALEDYGYPQRPFDPDRTAVILGNAMAGERHYRTSLRVFFPEYAQELSHTAGFAALPEKLQREMTEDLHRRMNKLLPEITEDSMPGELANCIAGRIANLFNFHGPNFVCDAACASAMAAINAAVEGLVEGDFDVALTGGIDRNMGAPTFVKFCKIGALSATGTRPYAEGADGFVMGEGAALFLLKRLADAERDGDKIYAVLRGMGGSSDGRGKGITAPNPIGQKLCIERAWKNAGLSPATVSYIEGHGTSTRVGDVVEVNSMADVLKSADAKPGSVALGSVKSNIGHLKGAAGAAGLMKAALALHHKVLPPSLNFKRPNPDINFADSPLYVNAELRPWEMPEGRERRAGLSAFGFGGTNFHAVIEEYIPDKLNGNGRKSVAVSDIPSSATSGAMAQASPVVTPVEISAPVASATTTPVPTANAALKAPLRGALVIGAATAAEIAERLRAVRQAASAGNAPVPSAPAESDLRAPERLVIDYVNAPDLADKCGKALKALAANQAPIWKALRPQGIFRGSGAPGKVAFLYTGQGSQYVNMIEPLRAAEPIVAEIFDDADRIMTPLLGKPLSEFIFVDPNNADAVAKAEEDLRQTEITQPTVLTIDLALTRLLAAYGIRPDMTMGHSLGEYGALVASGSLTFGNALRAVSARGRGMTQVAVKDTGKMAAVFAPLAEVERILKTVDGYVVIANVNSGQQSVIGGASRAVEQASELFLQAGFNVVPLPVSHAFHTSIVAPASEPLREMLMHLDLQSPTVPVVANVNGEFYPTGENVVPQMLELLALQVASPVQFVKGLNTLYDAGARVFVEVGPKKALQGFAEEVLGGRGDVVSLFTNHPKVGDVASFNQALCGLYAAGLGSGKAETRPSVAATTAAPAEVIAPAPQAVIATPVIAPEVPVTAAVIAPVVKPIETAQPLAAEIPPAHAEVLLPQATQPDDNYVELGHLMADVLERAGYAKGGRSTAANSHVVITGAALGLPGTEHIFDDSNVARILRGDQFIRPIPADFRQAMLEKRIRRLVKSDNGGPTFESIDDVADVIKLAGRGGAFDLESEFGISAERIAAFDRVTRLAIACGIDAMRDAGIPLVMRYKTTTKGTQLPERWGLPDALRDETGVIFGSAFPGYDSYAEIMGKYYTYRARHDELAMLEGWRARSANGHSVLGEEIDRRITELRGLLEKEAYVFDRRFLLRVLSMGHSQFAELIGARGPNTQINAACATTAQAVGLAQDWIQAGRCRRVIVISADDVTSDNMIEWFGPGFLASGAAATDEKVEEAAIPFDRRRHGLIMGMGAAALVVETSEAARERGVAPICEVLSTVTANSAFHGTRLDVQHIGQVMEDLVSQAEKRGTFERKQGAPQLVFVSHETYTPARGGSASAEVNALRQVFREAADQIVIANTKGYTGHAMATGIEDVLAVKALETGLVPPVANFKEVDPELGRLNLSKGGSYPVEYALHLGAGFGSQISMMLLRWVPTKDRVRQQPNALGYDYRIADRGVWDAWLTRIAGKPVPQLEVVSRTLRVPDKGFTARVTAPEKTAVPVTTPAAPVSAPAVQAPAAIAAAVTVPTITVPPSILPATPPPLPEIVTKPAATVAEPKFAPSAPVAVPAALNGGEAVKDRVLALVSEKTGYPIDMLDLDLDMEADLGVDTVKQAEVFAAIRESYGIARDDTIKLREFPTLAHVIGFVYSKRPDLAGTETKPPAAVVAEAAAVSAPAPTPAPAATVVAPLQGGSGDAVKDRVLALVSEKTGYPIDMLDLDLDMEADLGVDTVKQAEVFAAIRESYGIARDDTIKLREFPTLAHVIGFVYSRRPDLAGTATPAPAPPAPAPTPEATEVTTVAQPTSAAAASASANGDAVKERVLALVVEKTGYPADMLDLDLDLEADLGVDTVKQAEMFAAIREIYNIPRDENRKLRDYPTLAHVIRFVFESRPDLVGGAVQASATPAVTQAPAPTPEPVPATTAASSPTEEEIKQKVLEIVADKTGYPPDMLDLDLDLEADLGVDTVKQAEMFAAVRAAYNIPRDENLKLRDFPTLAHVIQFAQQRQPGAATVQPSAATPAVAQAPAPTPEPVPAVTAPTTTPTPTDEEIKQKVLEIVADKTGYPPDMLDLDLDLEADLGVDTVKQAEMFAAVRAAYNIPRDENLKLRDFPTLAHVIQFAQQRRPGAATAPAAPKEAATAPTEPVTQTPPAPKRERPPVLGYEATERVPRRVPVPVLRPPLNLCKPTGVTLTKGSRVVIMPDANGVANELNQKLNALGVETLLIQGAPDADSLAATLKQWLAAGAIQGVYWLPALNDEGSLRTMDLAGWREALRVRAKLLYVTMRTLFDQIAAPNNFLVTATTLGGQHGYDEAGATMPLGGAVTGFTKTFKRERAEATVKAVDFEIGRTVSEVAEALIAETLRDTGAVEIGYKSGSRWTVTVQEQPVADGAPGFVLDEKTVFVVTGAAGSIVSAITADLACASGGTFYLLDLVPEPDANSDDLKRFVTDKDGLKRDLFARIQARGERATPALVEKELAALERAQAAQTAIEAVRSAGGIAHYFSVNLTDADAIAKIIEQVRERSGHIDVLLHAAGIERSHFLPDKDAREFDLVFDVKSDGWFNLLHAIGDMPLGATVAFSSVAGRFGNAGQTDYSAANDLLCKITSSFRSTRLFTRGIVIDWTAWGGIGMATRGSIPKMMELAGIDMLAPEAGIPWIRRELTAGGRRGEIVVGQRLGVLLNEWDATGGLDVESLNATREATTAAGPMVGKVTAMGVHSGLTMETTLDPTAQPFLYDHRIDGTPVLPGVMGIEAFAEAALSVHPEWRVAAVEEVNFLAPFKFYRDEPRTLIVQAVFRPQGEAIVCECRLIGRRTLPGQAAPQETLHFTAQVRLTKRAPEASAASALTISQEALIDSAQIYRIYFHGPAYQVLERAWWDGKHMVGVYTKGLPANHQPAERLTVMSPRLIELCFQTAGLWEMGVHNRMGLPLHVEEVDWLRSPESAEGPLYAVVTPDDRGESFDAEVVDKAGKRYLHVRGYRTVALPSSVEVEALKAMRAVTV